MIVLRPDQQELKDKIYADWSNNIQNVMGVMPTGGGKSILVSDIVLDYANINAQQAVIAHRNELVSQMSLHVANRGIYHRIIGSDSAVAQITRQHREEYGKSFVNPNAMTAVVGVDTLISRREKLTSWALQTDLWIIDEAHHVLKNNKWGKAVDMFPNARGLGVTATPKRADGQGLGREFDGVFDTLHSGLEMADMIRIGALAPFEIVCPESDIIIDDIKPTAQGDWSAAKLKKAAKKSHIIGDVVTAYCQFSLMKQAICFATDIETSVNIADRFREIGIKAVSVNGKTPSTVREKFINEFRTGVIQILVNVDLFDEGFDVPACETVIMARPTASLGKYKQMVGRALRTAPGKEYGLIIDHVSNVTRHGLPDKVIPWSLGRADKRSSVKFDPDDLPLTTCLNKECAKPYERFRLSCPYCGQSKPSPKSNNRSIEVVDGDLILLDRETIEKMRQAVEPEPAADMAARVNAVAGQFAAKGVMNKQKEKIASHQELKDVIAQWAAIERLKGFNDREIYKKFYLASGLDVLSALDGSRSRSDIEIFTEKVKKWYEIDTI